MFLNNSLYFNIIIIIFFSVNVLTSFPPCRHICECIQQEDESNPEGISTGTLGFCLGLQGFFSHQNTIYLIASGCVYTVPLTSLLLARKNPRLLLWDKFSLEVVRAVPWSLHPHFSKLSMDFKESKAAILLHDAFFYTGSSGPYDKGTLEIVDFTDGSRVFLYDGRLGPEIDIGRFEETHFNEVINGHDGKGYLLVPSGTPPFLQITFFNSWTLFSQEQSAGYLLKINPETRSEARFMDGSSDELPEWKLIPSGKKIPYGIQYLTDTVILDVHTEKAYIFTTRPLDGSYDQNLHLPFPIKEIFLKNFFSCQPKNQSPSGSPSGVAITLILGLTAAIAGLLLVGVTFFTLFCKQSSIKAGMVRHQETRNVHYRYQNTRSGGMVSRKTATPTSQLLLSKKKKGKSNVSSKTKGQSSRRLKKGTSKTPPTSPTSLNMKSSILP